ncbi:transcriptional regulator FtrA [Glaciecola siphonariae]|uniref:Transcriptional regulator FtrA n=1 Tax=Glaciecola siphonariae TaxID=521012 RepID=A0ABV9LUM2_9ALTE
MTSTGNIRPMNDKKYKHSVAVLISDGLGTFEFGIAVEVFGLTRPEFNFPWYKFMVVSTQAKAVNASGGVSIAANYSIEALSVCDTIIIPSWHSYSDKKDALLIQKLREAAERGVRFLSICSGVFLLAQAGLLDGKKATTHWKHLPKFRRAHPQIELDENALYIDQGNVICSAGSAAGIDACLHLVRKDFGSQIANQVARRLVAHPHRDGGQTQFIPNPVAKLERNAISNSIDWALANLSEQITIKEMAMQAHMSDRSFHRRFRDTTGVSPLHWLQQARIAKSKELLETTNYKMEHIAELSGYLTHETFRVAFKKRVGVSPSAYRARFRSD